MASSDISALLEYPDGGTKLFGMENFGNTCYCNSILQCLYYTTKFRLHVLSHNTTPHERRLEMNGAGPHFYTTRYEHILAKKLKEKGKPNSSVLETSLPPGSTPPPRPLIRNSIFGKFSSNNTHATNMEEAHVPPTPPIKNYVQKAESCEALSTEQRLIIRKTQDFHNLEILVTRPSSSTGANMRNDLSVSSSLVLDPANSHSSAPVSFEPAPITSMSSFVVVGIPRPEQCLSSPINPFSPNPSADHRKRSALINGPIVNVDYPLLSLSESDEKCLLYSLKDIFGSMAENQSQIGVVSPLYFIKKLKEKNFLFRQANMHHDAHEFCNYLINETIETLNLELKAENNWCTKLFQGIITNETKCLSCETVTSRDESFLDLSIDIPPGESAYSLNFSLNNFSKLETLNHQNKFYCNACLSLQEAVKTIKLKKTPEVLIINFKRFKYDDKLDRMVKLFDSILYPLNLRLFNTTLSSKATSEDHADGQAAKPTPSNDFSLYGLYALVVHIGGGPMHGHYVALCKCEAGLWFLFDDETVEVVDDAYVLQFFGDGPGLASAYMLFYELQETKVAEDGLDFGINFDNIYNGGDYKLAQLGNAPVPKDEQTIKSTEMTQNSDDTKSFFPSEGKIMEGVESNNLGRTGSLLKKTLMLDSRDGEKGKDSTPHSMAPKYGKLSEYSFDPQRPSVKGEKKSWVGGLKRRELKPEISPKERAGSVSSVITNTSATADSSFTEEASVDKVKRRGSIFSFKRKNKS